MQWNRHKYLKKSWSSSLTPLRTCLSILRMPTFEIFIWKWKMFTNEPAEEKYSTPLKWPLAFPPFSHHLQPNVNLNILEWIPKIFLWVITIALHANKTTNYWKNKLWNLIMMGKTLLIPFVGTYSLVQCIYRGLCTMFSVKRGIYF